MKITRGGMEFELTAKEMHEAYMETKHTYDIEEVKMMLEALLDGRLVRTETTEKIKKVLQDEKTIEDVAYEYRGNLDNFEDSEQTFSLLDNAIYNLSARGLI